MNSSQLSQFEIVTSIRSDGLLLQSERNAQLYIPDQIGSCQFYMLRHHLDRLVAAAREFDWSETAWFLESRGLNLLGVELRKHLNDKYGDSGYPCPLKVFPSLRLFSFSWRKMIRQEVIAK